MLAPPRGLRSCGQPAGTDDVLAQPAVARIHNFFQLDDNQLGTAILDGIDADGLTAHPIDVEAHHRVDGRAALGAVALYDEQIARRIGANGAGPGGKTVERLKQRRRGDVLQRDDGDTKAIYIAGAHGLALRNKAVAGGIAHQRYAALFPAKSGKGRSHLARFICPSIPEQKKPDRLCAT